MECLGLSYEVSKRNNIKKQKDDQYYARQIAKELNLEVTNTISDINFSPLEKIKFVAENIGELNSDFTFLACHNLSIHARDRGFKVMLSGMGADEIFCGYPDTSMRDYKIIKLFKFFSYSNFPMIQNLEYYQTNLIDYGHFY